MEIGALSSSLTTSYAPRVTQADVAAGRVRQVSREASEITKRRDTARSDANGTSGANNTEALRKEARENRETQPSQAPALAASPRVQFKDAEGTRVMEVYDSKNILVYQVPPKGVLMLIHSQENQAASQIETSA
ncbi:MAG: hypothetical protein Q8M09_20680 [Pseudomonadota bacterium]|nr:hypothetical protein [Pseudomonadota bacterium]MDP2351692.1 hypothetical protein [Pseudomonadota bacterium]